jgi:hypothetical protein
MGMFDYIKCEYPLPEVPQRLVDSYGSPEKVLFQTKDTVNQCMATYKITEDGQLWIEKNTTKWVEAKDPNAISIMDRIGHSEIVASEWEKESLSGGIDFYEGYTHENYHSRTQEDIEQWKRFERGWIEYTAVFLHGELIGDITIKENTPPVELSDAEFEVKLAEWEKARIEFENQIKETRRMHPSPEQRLIDSIYNYASARRRKGAGKNYLAEEIVGKIDCYRDIHDTYYEKAK